ncbi:MAG: rRNA maturation RNase YbeY [Clostridia bacterium]|nr:rRNA maturation RNase YbeY [Clostridia bacterium]NCC43164.1 rRNA maturation RNase YbeY [Clostridia bacterium]
MTIEFEDEQSQSFDFDFQDVAKQVIEAVLDQEKCPYEADVSLVLTDNEGIQHTNREFRGIDKATDVLSFPMVDFPAPADYSILEEDESCFHPDSGELILGDIMISVPRALEQSMEYGHSVKREYAFLIAHSMLHLLGYDHMEDDERKVMEEKQEQVLRYLKIERR